MQVNRNSWHCKVYRWWYFKKYGVPKWNEASNLCPYMRAVMFWAPLRAIFTPAIKLGKMELPFNLVTIPSILLLFPLMLPHGAMKVFFVVYMCVTAVTLCLAVLVGVVLLSQWIDNKTNFREHVATKSKAVVHRVTNHGFWSLLGAYIQSNHDRVCPELNWKGH